MIWEVEKGGGEEEEEEVGHEVYLSFLGSAAHLEPDGVVE